MVCKDCGGAEIYIKKRAVCRACYAKTYYRTNRSEILSRTKNRYLANKEHLSQLDRLRRGSNKRSEIPTRFSLKGRYALVQYKSRDKGWYSDIGFGIYCELLSNPCFYCSKPLNKTGIGLDRKDSSKGYMFDNVVPCCKDCNRVKNDILTHDEMKAAMDAVLKLRAGHK